MNRTPGAKQNPDPVIVLNNDYACFDVPDPEGGVGHPLPLHSLVAYLPVIGGSTHLKVGYFQASCATTLAFFAADPARLTTVLWWGDYVR